MLETLIKTLRWHKYPHCEYFSHLEFGKFNIEGGSIAPLDFLKEGQYFRIVGSTFNDGVYKYPTQELTDEIFDGAIWACEFPPDFLALASNIEKYIESDTGKKTAYTSESFGGYSYSKATNSKGVPLTWEDVFADELSIYKKI